MNASAAGPFARSRRTRSSASAGVGTVPRGIHHSAVYASVIRSNHCLRWASTRRWVSEYTNAASASGVSQTDMFTMTPALPAWSHSKARTEVALPSSVCSRHTNPGAASAAALTGSSAATKSASCGLSSGARSRPMFTWAST